MTPRLTPSAQRLSAALLAFCTAKALGAATLTGPSPLESGRRALLQGQADVAVGALQATLAADPKNGKAHLLLCRVWLSEEMPTEAVAECQAALAHGLDQNSEAQDWTGRALGAAAERAGMLGGFKLAGEVRESFATAVALDPASEAANVDLGEYYTSAPAIVGGGNSKALALASTLDRSLPAVAHRIRAMAAERDKDFSAAEREFEAEAAVEHSPGALVDLAAFYERRQNAARTIEVAREVIAADPKIDANAVEAATLLENAHETSAAQQTLRDYLAHGDKSDTAPAFRVYTSLGKMQAEGGNKTAARRSFEQALALASHYGPAQKGLSAL